MSLKDKHKKVQEWLESVYSDAEVPTYEITEEHIEHLYSLMSENRTRDSEVQTQTDDMRHKVAEYNAEAERLNGVLKRLGLDMSSLSQSGVTSVQTLARLGESLELKHTSEASYMLGLRRLDQQLADVDDQCKNVQRQTEKLCEKRRISQLKSAKLKTALEEFDSQEKVQVAEMKADIDKAKFYRKKVQEYRKLEKKYLEKLHKLNLNPAAYHGALVKQAEDLEELKEKLHPLKEKFNTYNSLPPDITMTEVRIEEMRQQLALMDKELDKRINVLHM